MLRTNLPDLFRLQFFRTLCVQLANIFSCRLCNLPQVKARRMCNAWHGAAILPGFRLVVIEKHREREREKTLAEPDNLRHKWTVEKQNLVCYNLLAKFELKVEGVADLALTDRTHLSSYFCAGN